MAEMTQEMYGATGKVGNKTYYRANGKTVARQIVAPKNPKTTAQTYQRVIAAQVGKDYKMFKSIVDHSFQGKSIGFQCMNEFRKLNMRRARRRASEIQQSGNSVSQFYNFQPIGSSKWVPDACILSQGELPKVSSLVKTDELGLYIGAVAVSANTYAGVCEALGLKRGDQLTFVTVEKQNGEYVVFKSRIILDPRNADGSGAAMSSAFITDNAITNPNWRNDFHFTYLNYDAVNKEVGFAMGQNGSILVASAIIVSRKDGSEWLRSNSELVLSEEALGSDLSSLYDAVSNSYAAEDIDVESDMYLNNAGTGGSQGGNDQASGAGETPYYSQTIEVDGLSQNISGGVVNVTAPIQEIIVRGTNLQNGNLYLTIDNGEHIAPTSTSASAISFSGFAIGAGRVVRVYKNGTHWFTLNPQSGSLDHPEYSTPTITSLSMGGNNLVMHALDTSGRAAIFESAGTLTINGFNLTGDNTIIVSDEADTNLEVTVNEQGTQATVTLPAANTTYMIQLPSVEKFIDLTPVPVVSVDGNSVSLSRLGDAYVGTPAAKGLVKVESVLNSLGAKLNGDDMTEGQDGVTATWSEGDEAVISFGGWNLISLSVA